MKILNNSIGLRVRVTVLAAGHGMNNAVEVMYEGTLSEVEGGLIKLTDVTLHHGGSRPFADQILNVNAYTFVGMSRAR